MLPGAAGTELSKAGFWVMLSAACPRGRPGRAGGDRALLASPAASLALGGGDPQQAEDSRAGMGSAWDR